MTMIKREAQIDTTHCPRKVQGMKLPLTSKLQRVLLPFCALLVLVVFALAQARAEAQAPLRWLTRAGDVMEFVWAPDSASLYVTRQGQIVQRDARRQQILGDLYRVNAVSGAGTLLARNANSTRAPGAGEEIAYTRLGEDGIAQAIIYNPSARREFEIGRVTFGMTPQWDREGETLFILEQGRLRRTSPAQNKPLFAFTSFPDDARVSPLGDRVAVVDANGLWVIQDERTRVVASEDGVRVLPPLVWSNDGAKLAYLVTRDGFDPQFWVYDSDQDYTRLVAEGSGLEHWANPAWSPDDNYILFTRTPTGSATASHSEIWRARADGAGAIPLTSNDAEETLPQYAPDGKSIAFLRAGDVWVMQLDGDGRAQEGSDTAQEIAVEFQTRRVMGVQRTAPATIRVRHDAGNACRSTPIGQIDMLDFELYVKRVVPSEVFPSWDDDALKTQAVAARTYAWFWILQNVGNEFDVTDTTAYQYMCETQYASTDSATEATRGQYLDYAGYMVFAAYGAENGDPTLMNSWGNPYLLAVNDPVGFMKLRAGNGIGYSQWGAQRWATRYDWDYQQILLHYYSGVTLEAAAGIGGDVTPPIGAIVSPWRNWGIIGSHVRFVVNASDDSSGIDRIELWAQYQADDGAHNEIIATLYGSEREYLWDVTNLPNQDGIRVTPILYDGADHSSGRAGVIFELDRKEPLGTMNAPASTTGQTIVLNLNASDTDGGELAGMMFSNDWEWQGEDQSVENNSASAVDDPAAVGGKALRGQAGVHSAGTWYGPYTDALPVAQPYRAYFRLKTDNVNLADPVARLDVVVDGGAEILGIKELRGLDFRRANEYQEFYVEFYYDGFSTNALEFRTAYRGNASLWLDRILVVRYPVAYAPTTEWTLSDGGGYKRVIAKFNDRGGNVSPDIVSIVYFGQNPPPALVPRSWLPLILQASPP